MYIDKKSVKKATSSKISVVPTDDGPGSDIDHAAYCAEVKSEQSEPDNQEPNNYRLLFPDFSPYKLK